jgi:cytochrome c-type biogenesis protein CcmE
MKAKHQRLVLAVVALVAVGGAGLLAAGALRDEAAYFRTPIEVQQGKAAVGEAMRLGGMVQKGSLQKLSDGVTIRFIATDGKASLPVEFAGIAPDLFKEESGMVADGVMRADGVFEAERILAKHDERYMPPELEGIPMDAGSSVVEPAA